MARPASQHPTELELGILKVLWRDGAKPVRHVRDALASAGRDLAYTSVMTVMNIMADKGYVRRNKNPKDGGGYVYHPQVKEQATTGRMLRDLVDRAFDGSAAAAMVNLLQSSEVSDEELKQLRELIQRRGKQKDAKP
jgi:BlaI family transcriptional regulator, penicillinase repressor